MSAYVPGPLHPADEARLAAAVGGDTDLDGLLGFAAGRGWRPGVGLGPDGTWTAYLLGLPRGARTARADDRRDAVALVVLIGAGEGGA